MHVVPYLRLACFGRLDKAVMSYCASAVPIRIPFANPYFYTTNHYFYATIFHPSHF